MQKVQDQGQMRPGEDQGQMKPGEEDKVR